MHSYKLLLMLLVCCDTCFTRVILSQQISLRLVKARWVIESCSARFLFSLGRVIVLNLKYSTGLEAFGFDGKMLASSAIVKAYCYKVFEVA